MRNEKPSPKNVPFVEIEPRKRWAQSRIRGGLITHSRWAHFVSSLVGFISYSRWAHYQFSLGQLIKYSRWAHYAAKLGPTQNCYKSLSMYGESGSQH